MIPPFAFRSAGQLHFGSGCVAQLAEVVQKLGGRRVFVVTDAVLEKAGIVGRVCTDVLAKAGLDVRVYPWGEPEPSLASVVRFAEQAKRDEPDVVVGLGGGSNMDAAKIVAAVLTHGGGPLDYVGEDKVPGPTSPWSAYPPRPAPARKSRPRPCSPTPNAA